MSTLPPRTEPTAGTTAERRSPWRLHTKIRSPRTPGDASVPPVHGCDRCGRGLDRPPRRHRRHRLRPLRRGPPQLPRHPVPIRSAVHGRIGGRRSPADCLPPVPAGPVSGVLGLLHGDARRPGRSDGGCLRSHRWRPRWSPHAHHQCPCPWRLIAPADVALCRRPASRSLAAAHLRPVLGRGGRLRPWALPLGCDLRRRGGDSPGRGFPRLGRHGDVRDVGSVPSGTGSRLSHQWQSADVATRGNCTRVTARSRRSRASTPRR